MSKGKTNRQQIGKENEEETDLSKREDKSRFGSRKRFETFSNGIIYKEEFDPGSG